MEQVEDEKEVGQRNRAKMKRSNYDSHRGRIGVKGGERWRRRL